MDNKQRTIITNEDDNRKLEVYTNGDVDASPSGLAMFACDAGGTLRIMKQDNLGNINVNIQAGGSDIITAQKDNLSQYKCADIADSTDPNYYGFIDKDGNWYILENNLANNTFRYVKGSSGYTTAWTNRATQSYDYFYNIF